MCATLRRRCHALPPLASDSPGSIATRSRVVALVAFHPSRRTPHLGGTARRSRDTASAGEEPLDVPHVLTSHARTTGAKVRRSDARRRGTRTGHHLGRYSLRRHRRADEGPRDLGTDVDVPEVGLVIDSRGRILDQVRLVGLRDCHRQVLLRGSHRGDDRAIELDQSSLRGGRTSRAATRDACFG